MQDARTEPVEDGKERADLEKYRALGGWVEKPDDLQPALEGDVSADVVIVGAGFAGLSAAVELARQGAKVVVIEREFPGFGASGRNAGYLAGAMGLEYDLMLRDISKEQATQIVRYYDAAVGFVEGKLKEHDIDCEYVQSGWIRAGVHPSQEQKIRDEMRIGAELGHKSQFLDQAQMRARGIPPAFLFGEYTPTGGTLHPGKYVMGLRRAALRAGVKLYENTPLLSYTEGPVIQVKTPRGSASAPVLLFATNAYTPQLGLLANKVVPLRISAIETEPLSDAQLASLGWSRREGIVTAHYSMESFRLTARNTIISTVKRIHYVFVQRAVRTADTAENAGCAGIRKTTDPATGQAKRRGSKEARISLAQLRARPDAVRRAALPASPRDARLRHRAVLQLVDTRNPRAPLRPQEFRHRGRLPDSRRAVLDLRLERRHLRLARNPATAGREVGVRIVFRGRGGRQRRRGRRDHHWCERQRTHPFAGQHERAVGDGRRDRRHTGFAQPGRMRIRRHEEHVHRCRLLHPHR
ncbi:FAD-dependent oxidoreductase [Burkholderia metallica]|nr:FAD-dependent oxidoreductase [Burkholderia metallica]